MKAGLAALLTAGPALADVVLTTDQAIVQNDMCMGNDCQNAEDFSTSFEELKLKGTSVRLRFDDTSTNPSFPDRDWAIETNGTLSTDPEEFRIEDETAGTRPFLIQGGAPSNSVYVASDGDVGLGTMMPQTDLHVVSPSGSAALRLNGSGVASSWDMIGGSGGFILQDVGAGTQPIVLDPGLPNGTILATLGRFNVNWEDTDMDFQVWGTDGKTTFFGDAATGNVGLGILSPVAPLHVSRADGSARVLVENTGGDPGVARELFKLSSNGGAYFTFENTNAGTTWFFNHENAAPNRFIIADGVADGPELTLTADGDMTIPGRIFTGGSCAAGCDRVFDADYPLPSFAEQMAAIREKGHLPSVGPTDENGPFDLSGLSTGMLNELEKAYLYIDQLNAAHEAEMADLRAEVAALAATLEALRPVVAD
ncbi:hypothetical protein ACOXXX_06610 [Thalassococcus sp. BH17M4-6]